MTNITILLSYKKDKTEMKNMAGKELSSKEFLKLEDQWGAHNYDPIPVVISKAEGCWVWDPEGKKYLDCLAAYSAVNHGHLHPKIVEAVKNQLERVTLTSRAFCND